MRPPHAKLVIRKYVSVAVQQLGNLSELRCCQRSFVSFVIPSIQLRALKLGQRSSNGSAVSANISVWCCAKFSAILKLQAVVQRDCLNVMLSLCTKMSFVKSFVKTDTFSFWFKYKKLSYHRGIARHLTAMHFAVARLLPITVILSRDSKAYT